MALVRRGRQGELQAASGVRKRFSVWQGRMQHALGGAVGALVLRVPGRLVQGNVRCCHGAAARPGPLPETFALVTVLLAVKDSLGCKAGQKEECPVQGAVIYLAGWQLRKSLDSGFTAPGLRS